LGLDGVGYGEWWERLEGFLGLGQGVGKVLR